MRAVQVVLFRHGIAIDRFDPGCPSDEARWLTKRGARRAQAAARGLAALDVAPDLVLTSPLVRARQTAEIAADVLGGPEVRVTDSLRGGSATAAAFAEFAALDVREALCVGHAPQLDLLLERGLPPGHAPVERLKKAGAAALAFESVAPGAGRLLWQMAPRALRALGEETT